MTRRDPIKVFFFRTIIIRAIEKRDQPDRMPAKRLNETRRDFMLAIVVSDGFAKKFSAIGGAQRLKRIGIEAVAADSREDRIEQTLRQHGCRLEPSGVGSLLQHQRAIYVRRRQ